jgi:glycosyltransferase involved in cell wall biosynthesis
LNSRFGAETPLVTVVTVVRNGRDLLERTIRSVLGQSYGNMEYIIVDGASSDGTIELIRRYEADIAYWVSEPDKGLYDAMNKGIDLASGELINFMNAGDSFYDADTVQRVMDSRCRSADLIYGHCQLQYEPDTVVVWRSGTVDALWRGMIFRHQSLFTRATVCRQQRFDLSYKIGADFDFIFNCHRNGFRFCRVDLTVASVGVGGFSDVHFIRAISENKRAVQHHLKSWKVSGYYTGLIALTALKSMAKRIMPQWLKKKARFMKFGRR